MRRLSRLSRVGGPLRRRSFNRPTRRAASGLTLALLLSACQAPDAGEGPYLVDELDGASTSWVERTLEGLTLEQAVGQLVFPWLSGAYAPADDPEFEDAVEWVERWGIGGVAISIGTPHAYVAKLNELQERAAIPLLVTSDFENGGPGMRINHTYALPTLLAQGGGTSFPPTMAFGAIGDEAMVERFAEITAAEARAVGVHMNFAPVLDVNSNPENPIINTRSFGEDPAEVARLGRAYIRGARAGGVLTTAKHFPGHGDTRVDSHLILPEVSADRARLDAVELVPFQAAVDEGVDAVMTAHVSVPGVLGPAAPPATLAPEFMTNLLRDEMAFDGLLFTDALRMGAITEGYGGGEAAVLALEAGADVILVPETVSGSVEAVVAAVEEGRLTRERIDRSVRRILEAKARVGVDRDRIVDIEAVATHVGVRAHRDVADEAATRSMTLPRDRDGLLPLDPERVERVLSVTYGAVEDLVAGREMDAVLGPLVADLVSVRIGPESTDEALADLMATARAVDVVLFNAYVPPRAGAGTVALPDPIRDLLSSLEATTATVLVSFGNPYLLNAAPEIGTYLVAWGDREVSQRAAARAVAGAEPISGRMPITLPGLHERGAGLDRAAIPEIAALGARRRDALDEAGLVRTSEDAADSLPGDPPASDPPLPGGPDTPGAESDDSPDVGVDRDASQGDGVPPGPRPDVGVGGPFIPPGPEGRPAPSVWAGMPVSPLEVPAPAVGMDPAALARLDAYVAEALEDSVSPGASLAIGRSGRLVRLRGYGRLDWAEASAAVTPFSLYDLASLTKVVGTTSAVMLLVQDGTMGLDDPVVRFLPEFPRGDARKADVTVRDLLLHRAGLPPFEAFYQDVADEDGMRAAVYDLALDSPPGSSIVYSDIGFMTLGWVVEAASGEQLDAFLERRLFDVLGMRDTRFLPDPAERPRIAPTEEATAYRPRHLHGEVHDENAHAMGGVAGHAGLFSTAQDLAVFAGVMAAGGMLEPCEFVAEGGTPCGAWSVPVRTRVFDAGTLATFTERGGGESSFALGWDTPSGRSSAGEYFSARSFGHTGFTGTSIWIDPDLDLFVVLLTNRVNPTRENDRHVAFRRTVHDLVAQAVIDRTVMPRDPQ